MMAKDPKGIVEYEKAFTIGLSPGRLEPYITTDKKDRVIPVQPNATANESNKPFKKILFFVLRY